MRRREAYTIPKIEELKRQGFRRAFGIRGGKIFDKKTDTSYEPAHFDVVGEYRFGGVTNPEDETILLALRHVQTGAKGTLLAPYGPAAAPETHKVLYALDT